MNDVNACGSGAVSGQRLPGLPASQALESGVVDRDDVPGFRVALTR